MVVRGVPWQYIMNVCTHSYTLVWHSWEDWFVEVVVNVVVVVVVVSFRSVRSFISFAFNNLHMCAGRSLSTG